MATIVNLTPHAVSLISPDGTTREFPSQGLARVAVTRAVIGEIDGTPVCRSIFGQVEGLPEPAPNTFYIVSMLVAQAARNRTDLICPDNLVRDEAGRIVGCRNWCRP